jgi:uncharacterized membrane protein
MRPHLNLLRLATLFILFLSILFWPASAIAQDVPTQTFSKARVEKIGAQGIREIHGFKNIFQKVTLKFLDGPNQGETLEMEHGGMTQITAGQKVHPGETVVVMTFTEQDGQTDHIIVDSYRLPWLAIFAVIFVVFVLAVTGWKGVGSLAGLTFSLAVIIFWVAPQILRGADPLLVSIGGSFVILFLTTYLAHGISRQTTMALLATFGSLIITGLLAALAIFVTRMTGISSDEVYSLQLNQATASINTQGLLLGGIIIGMVGALNDVTTTQAATVFELVHSMSKPAFPHVIKRSLIVGREHILSLVNTLVLAYAGSSLVVFLFLVLNPSGQPLWVILNGETLFDEVIRTIIGSFGLILAVPVVTFLAAWSALRKAPTEAEIAHLTHHH